MMQERNSGNTQMDYTKTMNTAQPLKFYPLKFKKNAQSLTNTLSFAVVASKFRITIDTELDPSINTNPHDGTKIILKQCREGLYYFNTTNKAFAEYQTKDCTLLNTAESNKS